MGLREQKRERQRDAIIDMSMDLFARQGYEATRVQDIARELAISEATFFNYFPTKQAALDAGVARHVDRIIAAMDQIDDGSPVLARVSDLFRQSASIMRTEPRFAALVALNLQMVMARGSQHEIYKLLAGLLEEGQHRGEIRSDISAAHLSETLIGSVLATMSNCVRAAEAAGMDDPEFGQHIHQRVQETWTILCTGIAPSGSVHEGPKRHTRQRQASAT